MRIVLSSNALKVCCFILIPLLIVTIIFSFGVFLYNAKNYDKKPNETSYWVNYWSDIISIIFCAILLAVSIGFSLANIQIMKDYQMIEKKKIYYYLFCIFPLFSFLSLIIFIGKFRKNLKQKYLIEKEREESYYEYEEQEN